MTSIPIIATDSDAAKVAAVAVELFGHAAAAQFAREREAAARHAGDLLLAETWRQVGAEVDQRKPH